MPVVLAGSAVAIWRPANDPFTLPKATVAVVGAVLLAAFAIVRVARWGSVRLPTSPLAIALVAFAAALVVATLTSGDLGISVFGTYKRYTGLISYLAYAGLCATVLRAYDGEGTARRIAGGLLVAGGVVAGYGVLQALGADPLDWENLYGDAVFSTLGNPNFAGAYAGIVAPVALWGALRLSIPMAARVACGALFVACVITAIESNSFQGPVTVAVGAAVFGLAWVRTRSPELRRWGTRVWLGGAAVGGLLILVGLAGSGPLGALGADGTLQLRRWYWDAALNMLTDNPIVGVGLDRYGANYRAFRSEDAALGSSFTTSADAPHNVVLDMFAEGGALLGLAYVAVLALTAWALVQGLRRLEGERLLLLGALGGAWAAYQAQAMVSIDVAGLAVAHWVLAGAIVVVATGPSVRDWTLPWAPPPPPQRRKRQAPPPPPMRGRDWAAVAVAVLVGTVGVWTALRPLRADMQFSDSRRLAANGEYATALAAAESASDAAPWEPTYWFQQGSVLLDSNQLEASLVPLQEAIDRDPRGLEQLVTSARVADALGQVDLAAARYEEVLEVEPQAPEMTIEIARFFLSRGMFERGTEVVEDTLTRVPDRGDIWLLLAQAQQASGNMEQARVAANRALELVPGYPEATALLEQLESA